MSSRKGNLGTAAGMITAAGLGYLGAKYGDKIGKQLSTPNNPIIPEGMTKDTKPKDILHEQKGDPSYVTSLLLPYSIWYVCMLFLGWVWDISSTQTGKEIPTIMFFMVLITLPVFIGLILGHSYRQRRMEAAICAVLDFKAGNLMHMDIDEESAQIIPAPSQDLIAKYNKQVEEYKKKIENPAFDDKYFPDFKNLSFKQKELIYDVFTEPVDEPMKNYWTWLATKPEEEQNQILDQMKQDINKVKIAMFDQQKEDEEFKKFKKAMKRGY